MLGAGQFVSQIDQYRTIFHYGFGLKRAIML